MNKEIDPMMLSHIEAFDFANEVAKAVDPTGGDAFKTAFMAAALVAAHRQDLTPAPTLIATGKPKGKPGPKTKGKPGRPPKAPQLVIDDGRYTYEGAARYLGFSAARLTQLRAENRGPVGEKFGTRVVFTETELRDWKDQRNRAAA